MDDSEFLASGLDDRIVEILAEDRSRIRRRFHVAGRPHVKVHVYRGIVRDLLVLIPLAALVMAFVLACFFRSVRGVCPASGDGDTREYLDVWHDGRSGSITDLA